MQTTDAIVSGAAGAAALTLTHEVVRRLVPRTPRLDKLGMLSIARLVRAMGGTPPRGERLRGYALAGDLLANTLYYAPIAAGRHISLLRGTLVGLAAGVGAVALTPVLGLPRRHRGRTPGAMLLTVGLYTLGGVIAAAAGKLLRDRETRGPAGAAPAA